MIVAVVIAIWAIANYPEKIFRGFNTIETHGLYVSAALLHQLNKLAYSQFMGLHSSVGRALQC